ncbi:MAG TPA: CBS domain-containing protein [Solirubrobacterales bacterium]|nr:CBS domain-containing protein [Solirubrobacterales bacterium]
MPATMTTARHRNEPFPAASGDYLETPVRDFMTPGVLTIAEDASLRQVYRAMVAHSVHAVLVVGRTEGRALGWVTSRGLLAWVGRDQGLASAREAITERPITIEPGATARDALTALSQVGTSHLLVARRSDVIPEGVVSELDIVALEGA